MISLVPSYVLLDLQQYFFSILFPFITVSLEELYFFFPNLNEVMSFL